MWKYFTELEWLVKVLEGIFSLTATVWLQRIIFITENNSCFIKEERSSINLKANYSKHWRISLYV